jgi:16S rRNA (guanine966-N2)-methyltransferase
VSRIVAGVAGGRRLVVPKGRTTRPTAERVREALFSSLESSRGSLAGARVLDLYAGSGAVGFEAASRGAAQVVLVERAATALAALRANAAALGLAGIEIQASDVVSWLAVPADEPFDVVYVDPPYAADPDPVIAAVVSGGWLAPGGTVVVERDGRGAPPTWPQGLAGTHSRRYGDSTLWYGSRS